MARNKKPRKTGQPGPHGEAKSSWRTAIIISAVVLGVIILMYALDMTQFLDGGY